MLAAAEAAAGTNCIVMAGGEVFNKLVKVIVANVIISTNFYYPKVTVSNNRYKDRSNFTDSFSQFYDKYLNYVYAYISYRIIDKNTVADLTSAVFEKALTAFHKFDAKKASPQTWLITIARNTVTDYLREYSRKKTVALDDAVQVEAADPSPQEQTEKKEEYDILKICISILPPREQEVISLKFGSELNNRNIASMLKMSGNNVGIILFRAIRKLRNCFQEWLDGKKVI
jgi:RNA polymerase sigma-70 factor (ECF subfamily)